MVRILLPVALAGSFFSMTFDNATAQQPTQAQRDAIRGSCRSDFIANCAGVQPGGREAFECLVRKVAKLSAACKSAVDAISAPRQVTPTRAAPVAPVAPAPISASPAAAPTPSQVDELKSVQQVCTLSDFVAHCSWIAPTSPELLLCLKANVSDLSPPVRAPCSRLPQWRRRPSLQPLQRKHQNQRRRRRIRTLQHPPGQRIRRWPHRQSQAPDSSARSVRPADPIS
jgi:hypothetical protein